MKKPTHNNISKDPFRVVNKASGQVAIRVGYLVLIGFAILKPLLLIIGQDVTVGGVAEITDLMGIGISYLFILPLLAGLRQLQFDRICFLILLFCLYIALSLFWGSEIRKVAQTIIPFLLYFSVRMFITESNQMKTLLTVLVIGFLIPIAMSTYNIVLGRSIEKVEILTELPRHAGAFSGSHTLAYVMLFFSFLYCILHQVYPLKNFLHRSVICFFLILSFYCLYQSHTRTAIFGLTFFWFIYLWGNNKRLFYVAVVLSIFAGIIFHSNIKTLIWKQEGEYDLKRATSGRTVIWAGNIKEFIDSSLPHQLIGRGLGHKTKNIFTFHNDYLRLLMNLGVIGLFLYLILLFYLLYDIFLCKDKKTQYLFLAILISVAAMNFGSNAVIFRLELSQYFWLIMGFFYCILQIKNSEYDT